jgi:hypothetical protein
MTDRPVPRRPGRSAPSRSAVVTAVLALILGAGASIAPSSALAADRYALDVARSGDYVAQTNFVQCVGASMQMMANMISPRDDRTAARQLELQRLARTLSGPSRTGRERQGASVRGWTAGLNHLGYGPYRLVGAPTLDEAMRMAARSIAATGRPVGLLVWRGRHAWVMSGFEATADPMRTDDFAVTGAYILDPLYPHGSASWGPSPRPGTLQSVGAVGRQFVARGSGASAARWLTSSLSGRWVMVLPVDGPGEPWASRLS